jgi:hypothetical protein
MIQACACDLSLMSLSSFEAPSNNTSKDEHDVSAKVGFELEIEFEAEASFDWNIVEIAAMDWANNDNIDSLANDTNIWANNTEPWNTVNNTWEEP